MLAQRRLIPTAMEPPAKRMRLSHAIGVDTVDESNPDYIEGQRRNNEQLKNSFESIFAKYAAVSDMMSDEIDMRTGEIVKDRGHMRSLDKEYRKQLRRRMASEESQLPDDLFRNDPDMGGEEEDEELDGDERDELAPSMSPEPTPRNLDALPAVSAGVEHAPPLQAPQQVDIPVPDTPANALRAPLATSATPAAHLIQLVQFPQTPAGQQARKAFEVQTAQAVQQAVASILSSLLPDTSAFQPQLFNPLQSPATPTVDLSEVAPATAPNLFPQPQPYSAPALNMVAQSSPVTASHTNRRQRAKAVHIRTKQLESSREHVPLILEEDEFEAEDNAGETEQPSVSEQTINGDTNETLELVTLPKRQRARRGRYIFTVEDDQHIIESKIVHKLKWADIISSRAHWKNWPMRVFHNHWSHSLAKKAATMDMSRLNTNIERGSDAHQSENPSLRKQAEAENPISPTHVRHLPTPSSLEQDEGGDHDEISPYDNLEDTIASGGHFDDDEKDLLSIYGDDTRPDVTANSTIDETEDEDDRTDDGREIPETPLELTQEDSIQQLLQGTVTRENTADIAAPSVESQNAQMLAAFSHDDIETVITSSPTASFKTPTTTRFQQTPPSRGFIDDSSFSAKSITKLKTYSPTRYEAQSSNSDDDDINLLNNDFPPTLHQCPRCKQTFPTTTLLRAHEKTPHPKEVPYRPSSPLPAATQFDPLATEDSPPPPTTPTIKLEPMDPPRNFLLSSPEFRTPMSAPHAKGLLSSGAKSSGKMSRSAYNRVKASWAQKGRGSPVPGRRRSLKEVPRKRVWEEESEDELAM